MNRPCEECRRNVFAILEIRARLRRTKRFAAAHHGHQPTIRGEIRALAVADLRRWRHKATHHEAAA